MGLRNNLISGGDENAVATAVKLMVTVKAVLSDSSHSKDTTMNPAHPSSTRRPAAFINSFADSRNLKSTPEI